MLPKKNQRQQQGSTLLIPRKSEKANNGWALAAIADALYLIFSFVSLSLSATASACPFTETFFQA